MGFGGGNLKALTSGGLEGPNGILKHPSLGNIIGGGTDLFGSDKKKSSPAPVPTLASTSNVGAQTSTQSLTDIPSTGTAAGQDTSLSGPNILK